MASKACVLVILVRGATTGLLGPLAWALVPAAWCPLNYSRRGYGCLPHAHRKVLGDGGREAPDSNQSLARRCFFDRPPPLLLPKGPAQDPPPQGGCPVAVVLALPKCLEHYWPSTPDSPNRRFEWQPSPPGIGVGGTITPLAATPQAQSGRYA